MTSSAAIARILDPLVDPQYGEQDMLLNKVFSSPNDQVKTDYLRGLKRVSVDALDWAGDKLVIAAKDCSLRLYDVEKGERERSWSGDWMAVQCDPNQPFIAAAVGWTGEFRVFDTRSSSTTVCGGDFKRKSHSKEFLCLCWSPDSRHVAVSNRADEVLLLDLRVPSQLRVGAEYTSPVEVYQMAFAPDGGSLWLASGPGKISVLPAPAINSSSPISLTAHQHTAYSIAADPQGKYIATGGGDCLVSLWDPRHLVCVKSFTCATQGVSTLDFNYTGNLLAWGTCSVNSDTGERNLTIVGPNTGALYAQEPTTAPVSHVRWHASRNVLAYSVHPSSLPDEREQVRDRRIRDRDLAVVHTLKIPDGL